eukprot:1797106-Amphidinium_carterae.1
MSVATWIDFVQRDCLNLVELLNPTRRAERTRRVDYERRSPRRSRPGSAILLPWFRCIPGEHERWSDILTPNRDY